VTAAQEPEPLQLAAWVKVAPEQLAGAHEVLMAATWQDPPGPHRPVFPQIVPLLRHWPGTEGALPTDWEAQVPFGCPVNAVEQATHVPLHAELQHTPLTQFPVPHCAAEAHAWPCASAVHLPPAEHWLLVQSVLMRQLRFRLHDGQTPPPQSTSVSVPLRTASTHEGGWQSSGMPLHTPLAQSDGPRHFCCGPAEPQFEPHEPPQSTSLSSAS
jgi:hypothetical protein